MTGSSTRRRTPETSTTWRPPRRKEPPTASPARTAHATRKSCRLARQCSRITQTPRSCPWRTPRTPFAALAEQEELQKKYTGGTHVEVKHGAAGVLQIGRAHV